MNRIITLAAVLCLALTVSACGEIEAAGSSASASTGAPAGASASAATSAVPQDFGSETGRKTKTTLSMEVVEGQTEEVPATLYEGEGYSIYIPDEGWTKTDGKLPKGACDQWAAADNPDVTLTVCSEDETDRKWSASQTCVRVEQDDPAHDWYLYEAYPIGATEGFGARLSAITATFSIS